MRLGVTLAAAFLLFTLPCSAQEFFRDKIVKIIVASAPGGSYDAYGRLVARHLGDHLPGKPTVIVQNVPGASGVQGANYLYAVAAKDGTAIGTFDSSIPFYEAMGQLGVRFKSADFTWIATLSRTVNVVTVWHQSGVRTLDDAKTHDVIMGSLSAGGTNTVFPLILNAIVGTRFKIVTGYEGSKGIDHAMEMGEVQGRGSSPWSSWKALRPDWVRDHKIIPVVQVGLERDKDLPDVPLLTDLAHNEDELRMLKFVGDSVSIEHPFVGPPEMPPEILALYRTAFDEMLADPALRAEAAKENMDLDPMSGDEAAKIVREIVSTPPALIARVKALTELKQ